MSKRLMNFNCFLLFFLLGAALFLSCTAPKKETYVGHEVATGNYRLVVLNVGPCGF